MNYYKRHIGDYLKDTAHLSLLEHGIYTRLLDVYYIRESAIPEDQAARLIGARSKDECAAMRIVLVEFFVLNAGAWHQGRCEHEISAASDKAGKNREVGKLGGRPKKKETIMVSENNHDGFETEPTDNPSHKPLSSNTPIPPQRGQRSAVSLKTWADERKAAGEVLIPDDDPVFAYASDAGIPDEFMALAWGEFKARYAVPDAKRYKDWRSVFRKAVRGNWLKLWFADGEGFKLTTTGMQAQRVKQVAGA